MLKTMYNQIYITQATYTSVILSTSVFSLMKKKLSKVYLCFCTEPETKTSMRDVVSSFLDDEPFHVKRIDR